MNRNSQYRRKCPKCHGRGIDTKWFPDLKGGTMLRTFRSGRWQRHWTYPQFLRDEVLDPAKRPEGWSRSAKWVCINCGHERF